MLLGDEWCWLARSAENGRNLSMLFMKIEGLKELT